MLAFEPAIPGKDRALKPNKPRRLAGAMWCRSRKADLSRHGVTQAVYVVALTPDI